MAVTTKRGFTFDILVVVSTVMIILLGCKSVHIVYSVWGHAYDIADRTIDQKQLFANNFVHSDVCSNGDVNKNVGHYSDPCREAKITATLPRENAIQRTAVELFVKELNPCENHGQLCGILFEKVSSGLLSFQMMFGYVFALVVTMLLLILVCASFCCRRSVRRMQAHVQDAEIRNIESPKKVD